MLIGIMNEPMNSREIIKLPEGPYRITVSAIYAYRGRHLVRFIAF